MTPSHIDTLLQIFPFLIKDGGLATEIEKQGTRLGGKLWSAKILADDPRIIRTVHRDYLKAGADIILTASYQASMPGFKEEGYSVREAERLIKLSVTLAREAREELLSEEKSGVFFDAAETKSRLHERDTNSSRPLPLIAGSCGCYGAYLANASEYTGAYNLTEKQYIDFHRPRVELLMEAGCDFIAFETFPRADEAGAVAMMLEDYPGVKAWITFTVKNDSEISSGEPVSAAAKAVAGKNILGAGINCSDPQHFSALIQNIHEFTDKYIVVYPNSGEIFNAGCSCWKGDSIKSIFANACVEWYGLGAKIIGGCCRIGPDEINALSDIRKHLMEDDGTAKNY